MNKIVTVGIVLVLRLLTLEMFISVRNVGFEMRFRTRMSDKHGCY